MRIDAYTHFFPQKYFQKLTDSKVPDIGKRVREVPAIHDLDVRRKVIDSFPDYKQIICVALPPIGTWTPPEKAEEVARVANDGLKELCDKYPDQFAGFVAEVPPPLAIGTIALEDGTSVKGFVGEPRDLLRLLARRPGADRRQRHADDLLVVGKRTHDLAAHVEIVDGRHAGHALADVRHLAVHERLEIFRREKVRVRVDTHERCCSA